MKNINTILRLRPDVANGEGLSAKFVNVFSRNFGNPPKDLYA